jgi:hypothetical protein
MLDDDSLRGLEAIALGLKVLKVKGHGDGESSGKLTRLHLDHIQLPPENRRRVENRNMTGREGKCSLRSLK